MLFQRVLEIMGFTYRVPDDMTKEELDELLGVEEKDDSKVGIRLLVRHRWFERSR